jgi:hypothetical protein
MIRALVDPNAAPARSLPRKEHDLALSAQNGWINQFDNLSGLSTEQSDWLCRLSTGSGLSTRTLYQNDEETLFDATRPIMLNGITEPATRSDLLDRCLSLCLPQIEEGDRKTEAELWDEFEQLKPRIFGALLTAVSAALKALPSVKLAQLPRMADFVKFAVAAEAGLGLTKGEFLRSYDQNVEEQHSLAVESSPVAKAVFDLVRRKGKWSGTATQLKAQLQKERVLPIGLRLNAKSLSDEIRQVQQNLGALGLGVKFERVGKDRTRQISLSWQKPKTSKTPSAPSAPSASKPLVKRSGPAVKRTPQSTKGRSSRSFPQRGSGRSGRKGP